MKPPRILFTLLLLSVIISASWKNVKFQKETNHIPTGEASTFWAMDGSRGVVEWIFNSDSTVQKIKLACPLSGHLLEYCVGITYCNIDDKSSLCMLNPDLLHHKLNLFTLPDKKIVRTGEIHDYTMGSPGGYGKYLFIQRYFPTCYLPDLPPQDYSKDKDLDGLYCLRDTGLQHIVDLPCDVNFCVGDIAVDTLGHAWVLGKKKNTSLDSTQGVLYAYNEKGEMLKSIPVQEITCYTGATGFMLVDGHFYIAFSSDNRKHRNRLVALEYSEAEGVMKFGRSFRFLSNGSDLASKNPGVPAIPLGK